MNNTTLQLPARATKPRQTGLTMMIDGGLPFGQFADIVSFRRRIHRLRQVRLGYGHRHRRPRREDRRPAGVRIIGFYFGGTLFEKFVLQDRLDDFRRFCTEHRCRHVEVSNGTISLSNTGEGRATSASWPPISRSSPKSASRTRPLGPAAGRRLGRIIGDDLAAGASMVTLEARESGKVRHLPPRRHTARTWSRKYLLRASTRNGCCSRRRPPPCRPTSSPARAGRQPRQDAAQGGAIAGDLRLGLRADTLLALRSSPRS